MSYGFGMYFKHCENEGDAYLTAAKYVKELEKQENIDTILDNNFPFYVPSIRHQLLSYENMHIGRQMNEYWLHCVFELNFVFWPQYNLLGLLGETWPQAEKFFSNSIYFQNSCDQDYEESTWADVCPFFDEVVAQTKSQPITRKDVFDDDDDDEEEADEEKKEMYIRSKIYQTIFDSLALDLWLYGKDSEAFSRFTLSPIHTMEQAMDINRKLQIKIKNAGIRFGWKDMIIYTELIKGSPVCYKFSYDGFQRPEPTVETFKEQAREAVNDYLKTTEGKLAAKTIRSKKFTDIFPMVPEYILREHEIRIVGMDTIRGCNILD